MAQTRSIQQRLGHSPRKAGKKAETEDWQFSGKKPKLTKKTKRNELESKANHGVTD